MVSASSLLGAAGEYYIMSQLLRRGFIAALAPTGVPNCDIIVTDDIGDRLFAIQVKTRVDKGSDGGWHMSKKHETILSPTLFYTFLDFGKTLADQPVCYVVPSAKVANVIRVSHEAWLAAPGKNGRPHRDSEMRRLLPDYDKMGLTIGHGAGWLDAYREAWDELQLNDKSNWQTPK
jgi:hypothetical protein